VIRCLQDEALPPVVLAAAGDAVQVATRAGDPLGMASALRGLRATLQQAVAELRPAARHPKGKDGDEPDAERPPRGARGGASKFLTVPEAAQWLGLGERTVWRRISDGDIHVTHLGSRITRIALEELERFAAQRGRRRGPR
jgi:excisionase family DNA binding protein